MGGFRVLGSGLCGKAENLGNVNSACRFSVNLSNFAAKLSGCLGGQTVIRRWVHFSCRALVLAVLLLPLTSVGGCALLHKETWNLDDYRDERAVDIDHRLEHTEPNVTNPF
ncbi:MAG TPA: hypothetical protein VHE81_13740 [Lacipirellulaceae bacterium]|nr:hypothetical protein [Lacipirellulaceae bacterium]